jgi:hypothetical protein
MLEEECMLPQGSDKRLLQKLHEIHDKNTDYTKPRLASDTQFGVRHYAGDVMYDILVIVYIFLLLSPVPFSCFCFHFGFFFMIS